MTDQNTKFQVRLDVVCLADVRADAVKWLWKPYVPIGGSTLLVGDPGIGKTHLALMVAAAVTTGKALPENGGGAGEVGSPANVIYLTGEDDLAATIRPRFESAQGDASRFFAINGIVWHEQDQEQRRTITLADLVRWEQEIQRIRPAVLFVDPLQAFLGASVDMHRANEVRPVMDALGKMAAKFEMSVVILGHSPKANYGNALYKVLGARLEIEV